MRAGTEGWDQTVVEYLQGQEPHRLEIGAGTNRRPGWLTTDLHADPATGDTPILALDATEYFPIPSDSFDSIYTEHMIEHISFENGVTMLGECYRVLKPHGVLRIVTPSLGFLYRIMAPDRSRFEDSYREWAVRTFVPEAPSVTNAFFLNNFMRAWGHTFIYDRETLCLALRIAGFERISECSLNESEHVAMRNLENEARMPAEFLALESMVMEGVKGQKPSVPATTGRNLAIGKSAAQSSVSTWSHGRTLEEDAACVVSGIFTGSFSNHTDLDDPAWWRVDLERICRIDQVRIFNRVSEKNIMLRTSRFEIQLSDDDHAWQTVFRKTSDTLVGCSKHTPYVWAPDRPVAARFVRIQIIGRQFLHLDQVEIFGDDGCGPCLD